MNVYKSPAENRVLDRKALLVKKFNFRFFLHKLLGKELRWAYSLYTDVLYINVWMAFFLSFKQAGQQIEMPKTQFELLQSTVVWMHPKLRTRISRKGHHAVQMLQ